MSDTTPDPKPEVPAAASSADDITPAPPAPEPVPASEPAAAAETPPAAAAPEPAPAPEPAVAEPAWASEPAPAPAAAPAPPAYSPAPEAAPPAYSAPPAYQPAPTYAAAPAYSAPAGPRTNTLAIVSLIAGIAGFVFLPFIGHLVAVITGHLSLGQIKRTGEGGHGMALTGTILGWVGLALSILATIFIIIAAIGFAAAYPNLRTS